MAEPDPVLKVTDDFEVTWRDPEDAQYSWLMDDAHYDRPLTQMAREMFSAIMATQGRRTAFPNGYAFALNSGPTLPGPELEGKDIFKVWREEFLGRVKEGCASIRSRDYASISTRELAEALPGIFAEAAALHYLTVCVIQPFLAPTMALIEFCDENLGEDAGILAATALQETHNETSDAAKGLGELAEIALASPELAALVRSGNIAECESVPGGRAFKQRLDAFLEAFGWRAERWSALHVPTWAESPRVALMLISRFMEEPAASPTAVLRNSEETRRLAEARIEVRLAPDKLARFRELIDRCRRHVPMSEERTFCQLLIWGSLRVPLMALGRRLQAQGTIDDANDVAYISTDEGMAAVADTGLRLRRRWLNASGTSRRGRS